MAGDPQERTVQLLGAGRDLVLLVRVPKEILERSESLIVLPGEIR